MSTKSMACSIAEHAIKEARLALTGVSVFPKNAAYFLDTAIRLACGGEYCSALKLARESFDCSIGVEKHWRTPEGKMP